MQRSPRYLLYKPSYSCFCLKFHCHSNGVGRGRFCLTSFNSPTLKTRTKEQGSLRYLLYKPSYSPLCLKFHCHGNMGHPGVNLNDAIEFAVPENSILKPKLKWIRWPIAEIWPFEIFEMRGRSVGRQYTMCIHTYINLIYSSLLR